MIHHRSYSALACLGAALALSACAQWQGEPGAEQQPPQAAAASSSEAPVPPPQRTAKPAPSQVKGLRPQPRPAETASLPPVATDLRLVGLSERQTMDLLGPPAEETVAPPGKVWVYRANGCQLSVHLFPDMEKGGFYALDYTADSAKEECLGKVAGAARKRG